MQDSGLVWLQGRQWGEDNIQVSTHHHSCTSSYSHDYLIDANINIIMSLPRLVRRMSGW
jgi:hypothetical protein